MHSRPVLAILVACALALAGLVLTAAIDDRELAFTLGVRPTQVATVVPPQKEACQRPIDVPADAASVEFQVGTFHRPGPALEVAVRSDSGRRGSAQVPAGYTDNSRQRVDVDGIEEGVRISLCIRNTGRFRLALYGGPDQAARTSAASVDGRPQPADLTLIFHRKQPRSMLSLLPAVFDRASLFHPAWVGPWVFWLVAAAMAFGVPLLLAIAVSSAGALTRPDERRSAGGSRE